MAKVCKWDFLAKCSHDAKRCGTIVRELTTELGEHVSIAQGFLFAETLEDDGYVRVERQGGTVFFTVTDTGATALAEYHAHLADATTRYDGEVVAT